MIAGYRHIDTAVRYSTQAFMAGAPPNNSEEYYTAFKEGIKDSGVDRKDIWITFFSSSDNFKIYLFKFIVAESILTVVIWISIFLLNIESKIVLFDL